MDECKEVSKNNIKTFGTESKKKLKRFMVVKKVESSKDFKKIKVEFDDDLPMNKPVKLHLLTIVKMVNFTLNYF